MFEITEKIGQEMINVRNWFNVNKLSLNCDKTNYMVFGNLSRSADVNVTIDGVCIERVNQVKFLGVVLDEKLSWKAHVEYVKQKISKIIGILFKVKDLFDCSLLHMLYCSMILPYFTYCVEVWGNTYSNTTKPLVLLQKKAIRIINKRGYREHTNDLFLATRQLKFKDLVDLKCLILMWKAKQRMLPDAVQNLFHVVSQDVCHRRKHNFRSSFARTTQKQKCVSVYGVKLWNSMNNEFKCCTNVYSFKKMYKEKIMKEYAQQDNIIYRLM